MSVSVFVVALFLVAGVQSLELSKANWDREKAQVLKDQEAFIATHSENANAVKLIGAVWRALAKYDCAIGDKAKCKAIMDADKVMEEEIAGKKPSKEEKAAYLAESDDLLDDVEDALEIENALIAYILKKEPGKSDDLAAIFQKIKSEIESKE